MNTPYEQAMINNGKEWPSVMGACAYLEFWYDGENFRCCSCQTIITPDVADVVLSDHRIREALTR